MLDPIDGTSNFVHGIGDYAVGRRRQARTPNVSESLRPLLVELNVFGCSARPRWTLLGSHRGGPVSA
ncbi:hypothetical protein ACFO5K_25365 [Nocardia halotolerans]|uniref:Inositol monophosphatase family protein n=1 Tax=Nocardia halotolerans TaxID=1755878 RepID=A0ABV8VMX6_9NOCA